MDVTGEHLDSALGPLGWLRGGPGLWEMRDPREGAWHFASRGWYGLWGRGRRIVSQILTPWVRDGGKASEEEVCRPGSTQEPSLLLQSGTRALLHTLYPHGWGSRFIEPGW